MGRAIGKCYIFYLQEQGFMNLEELKTFKSDLTLLQIGVDQIASRLRSQIRWIDGEIEVIERTEERAKKQAEFEAHMGGKSVA